MSKTRQHQPLRVPNGWKEQDRALVIQLERLFDEIYSLTSRLEDISVTDVAYDATTKKLTLTINGNTTDITKIAVLDGNDKIPAAILPSYVDDVEEYADLAHFPATGEGDKIYVALDTGFTYRWSGSQYVRLNTYDEATQSASGLMSAVDKKKLDGIENGANNYSLPLSANGTRGGIQIGYTETGKKYAVKLDSEKAYVEVPWNDTKNSAGTTNWINKKLYLVGAETQATNPTTNSNVNVYIGTDNCLYSNGTKVLTSHQDISGKVDKTGDTVTGEIIRKAENVDVSQPDNGVSSIQYIHTGEINDANNVQFSSVETAVYPNGSLLWVAGLWNRNGNDDYRTRFGFFLDKDGNVQYLIDNKTEFKSALAPFTWGQLAGQ